MKNWLRRELSRRDMVLLALALVALKLLLASSQLLLVTPNDAPLDDTLMYNAAVSVAAGNWLGGYDWLRLGKHMFFPVWLAMLHTLHIPYLMGGQLLQVGAALAGAWAAAPVLKSRKARLAAFALLLWNPAASAAEVQLRVYRDNITPALTLLVFGGVAGFALRWRRPLKEGIGFLLTAGAGLAAFYLNREDAAWALPFVLVGSAVTLWFIWRGEKAPGRVGKSLALAIPFGVLAAGVMVFCAINQQYYGRFILSDFTSREFKDAYGALTRVTSEQPREKVPVPRDVRERLYGLSPAFASLEPYLETDLNYTGYGSVAEREFYAGGFYWVLRLAAYDAGYYADANTAKAYYEALAREVNALCDTGAVEAGPRRSATTPKIEARHVLPTLKEAAANLGRVLTFAEGEPAYWTMMSVQLSLDEEAREKVESFLGNGINWIAQENTTLPYYSPARQIAYKLLDAVRWLYAVLLPAGFALALAWQLGGARGVFSHGAPELPRMAWWIELGLLLSILLRCCMIAFLFVAAFNKVPHIMYLCPAHPLALLYAALGTAMLWNGAREKGRAHG